MSATDYLPTIGLEVHCQIKTETKMFCSCPTSFGEAPNSHTCPVCLGLPGALPVLNDQAIARTILTGHLLGCHTPPICQWDRKNYFYPDMPKNYQISQLALPLCLDGAVPLYPHNFPKEVQKTLKTPKKSIALTRIHLEEDVAKSTHTSTASLIDFNRAGTPLMEIVSEPDLETSDEAYAYLKTLQQILAHAGISDADMEKGQLRCDVNISVRPRGQKELGEKIELKNLNSISAVRRSIDYEIERQISELEAGQAQIQSTRRWDDARSESQLMRTKEDAHDYRYFPDPDLLPIETAHYQERAQHEAQPLPHQLAERFEKEQGLGAYDAAVLTSDRALAHFFEALLPTCQLPPKKIANRLINDLLAALNQRELPFSQLPLIPETFAALLNLEASGQVTPPQARQLLDELMESPHQDPAALAKKHGFEPVDASALESWIAQAIADNPEQVAEIQSGNPKLLNFLTGQVMKASRGKANPRDVTEKLQQKLLPS